MANDYIDLKIDTDRMTNGKEVAARIRGEQRGGIPWIVILDGDAKKLITGDGPEGNIGCPVSEGERAHFIKMIQATRKKLTDSQVAQITTHLQAFADKIMSARRR
ncbi:MAG: hypothetical protein AAEJ04_00420 [Planctomycetota bacterium]